MNSEFFWVSIDNGKRYKYYEDNLNSIIPWLSETIGEAALSGQMVNGRFLNDKGNEKTFDVSFYETKDLEDKKRLNQFTFRSSFRLDLF